MDDGPSPFTRGTLRDLFFGTLALVLMGMIPFAIADGDFPFACAAAGGAFLIWLIVRRINLPYDHRDSDPPVNPF